MYPVTQPNAIPNAPSKVPAGRLSIPSRRGWIWQSWMLLIWLTLSGCTNQQLQRLSERSQPMVDDASLLSGAAVFGAPATPLQQTPPILLDPHPSMAAFVASAVSGQPVTVKRLKALLQALSDQQYFVDNYAADATQTASKTFANKRGNCISYTAMFVVLARLANLRVSFQVVEVPPQWTAGSDYLVRSTHINALVHNIVMGQHERHDLNVDFNSTKDTSHYKTQVISDVYANSLFLANLGVAELQAGNNLNGFRYLRAGIKLAPTNIDLWINLAAFYATNGAPEHAQSAYLKALELKPSSRAVHAGLARAYEKLQRGQLAQQHLLLARRYQEKNPYYHFSIAKRALHLANYTRALEAINQALDLSTKEGSFHYLKAITLQRLGDANGAQQSLNRAQRLGADPSLQRRYPLASAKA